MWDDIKKIKSGKKELRNFGFTIGLIFAILGVAAFVRHKAVYTWFGGITAFFICCGLIAPAVLKPLQKAWMAISIVIGFFMSRIILAALFYAVITPTGLIMKISGKDILDERIDKKRTSYWHERVPDARGKEGYEKQF